MPMPVFSNLVVWNYVKVSFILQSSADVLLKWHLTVSSSSKPQKIVVFTVWYACQWSHETHFISTHISLQCLAKVHKDTHTHSHMHAHTVTCTLLSTVNQVQTTNVNTLLLLYSQAPSWRIGLIPFMELGVGPNGDEGLCNWISSCVPTPFFGRVVLIIENLCPPKRGSNSCLV